jgi:hypothetical protein
MSKYYVPKWSRQYLEEAYKTMSLGQIAKEQSTYPNAIFRALKYYGIPIKNKSEAQRIALERGTSINPKRKGINNDTKGNG